MLYFGRKPCAPTFLGKWHGCRGVWHTPKLISILLILLLFLGILSPLSAQNHLYSNVSLILKQGLWKTSAQGITYQDLTLDLLCDRSNCNSEIWGFAPEFNQADHQGTVNVQKRDNSWQIQVTLTINPDPWLSLTGQAHYTIQLQQQNKQFQGNFTGTFQGKMLQGKAVGTLNPPIPKPISNYSPVFEHPRLIFRRQQLPTLRQKAKTDYGKAILTQLQKTLQQPIYYQGYVPNGGYHATGYCFLSLLNQDPKAAAIAWEIVKTSINEPQPRLFELSPVVAGVALAYDLCYPSWNTQKRQIVKQWLAQQITILIEGTADRGWNPTAWSNWNARARGAAGLAALAILEESDTEIKHLLNIAERNIKRYLMTAIGEHGFGTEGDHYTTEPFILTLIPFIQAERNVLGKDFIEGSSAQWILPHYLMRIVSQDNELSISTYGRHRHYAGKSIFALGLGIVPERFLPGVMWLFKHYLGIAGDQSFGITQPYIAPYILLAYRDDIVAQNPKKVLPKILVDEQKGFYVFRKGWKNQNDFVASIYLKRQFLDASWSFPDAGSFRIWGLGEQWAIAGSSERKLENENVIDFAQSLNQTTEPVYFQNNKNGSGIVSLKTHNWLRSFAVDYSGLSGVPGLFILVDKLAKNSTWIMNTEGKVTIENQRFMIQGKSGATMQGIFIAPESVQLSLQKTEQGGRIIASNSDFRCVENASYNSINSLCNQFFVVMTVQKKQPPEIQVSGKGLEAIVKMGNQKVSFQNDKIILSKF